MRAARYLPFSDLADAGLAKIERALSADKVRDPRRLLDCLYVGQLSPKQDISDLGLIDPALLPAFETAFLQRLLLKFHYRDAKGLETIREVEPQALLILPPLWYLVAWDAAREDSATSEWTGSVDRKSWKTRSFVEDTSPSRMMFAPSTRCHAEH